MDTFDDGIFGIISETWPRAEPVDLIIRAAQPGPLPADGETQVGGVSVPSGTRIRPEQYKIYDPDGTVELSQMLPHIGWYTPTNWGDTAERWVEMASVFSRTGLWPVMGGPGNRCADPGYSASHRPPSRNHADDASNVLQRCWDGNALVDRKTGTPLPETRPPFLGVPSGTMSADFIESVPLDRSGNWGAGYAGVEAGILLVPATRPADVPRIVGWTGPGNYFLNGRDISAVLRSWEERFGAVLYQLGPTTMALRIARPPEELADAQALTEEHFLLCEDNFYPQDDRPPLSHDDYAKRLLNARVWDFWWD